MINQGSGNVTKMMLNEKKKKVRFKSQKKKNDFFFIHFYWLAALFFSKKILRLKKKKRKKIEATFFSICVRILFLVLDSNSKIALIHFFLFIFFFASSHNPCSLHLCDFFLIFFTISAPIGFHTPTHFSFQQTN